MPVFPLKTKKTKQQQANSKREVFCSWHEQQVVVELRALGTAAVHPSVLGLKNEETPPKPHRCNESLMLVKEFQVTHLSLPATEK